MKGVSVSSDESYRNLTELENVLEEFKTGEYEKADAEESSITEAVSESNVNTEETKNEVVEELASDEPAETEKTYSSPSLAEIDAKLNELAMTGGFGITNDDISADNS